MSFGMYAAVATGGALGAMIRYSISLMIGGGVFGIAGPMATLIVNVVGSAIMGAFAGAVAGGLVVPEAWRGFLAVGLLGALTTFSSFALDAGNLLQKQGMVMAVSYVAGSVLLSLTAFGICFMIMRGAQ